MSEPTLFDQPTRPAARRTDPLTSHQAAASIGPTELRESQKAVLRIIAAMSIGTDDAIASEYERHRERWGLPRQSPSGLRTRRKELVAFGLVEDSGKRAALVSGRQSIVWRYVR